MTPEHFRSQLRSGEPLLGTLLVAQSPLWPKIIKGSGLDFVFIDTEHIAIGRESLSWMCRTYAAMGVPPLVRLTSPNPYDATVVLDDGAAGVVAPYIERPEEAEALAIATKQRPLKGQRAIEAAAGETLPDALRAYIDRRH